MQLQRVEDDVDALDADVHVDGGRQRVRTVRLAEADGDVVLGGDAQARAGEQHKVWHVLGGRRGAVIPVGARS